jgi:hypothetical protein
MTPQKKDTIVKGVIAVFVLFLVVSIFSNSGPKLDKALKKQAKAVPDLIDAAESRIDKTHDKYKRLKASKDFSMVQTYAEKENWDNRFKEAKTALDRASNLYKTDLKPLIKENTPEVEGPVKQKIKQIKAVISEAETLSQTPAQRFSDIRKTIANADELNKTAQTRADRISQIVTLLETGVVAKALADFPGLAEKINARLAPAKQLAEKSRTHLDMVTAQYTRHANGQSADYAAFTDSSQALAQNLDEAQAFDKKIHDQMGQLYTSYTKILKDMKEDYYVTIKRESWDERSDFYDPRFATFTRQVSPEAYEILTSDSINTIAEITSGFTGSKFSNQVGSAWDELHLNPTDQWHGGHNAASFWVEDAREAYYHKYILEKDGETKETGWEKVNANVYDANLEFLGMAILAKPYGTFEEDQLTQAAPPGMAYVDNPKYGEWKEDDKGDRFWSWYGRYSFFSTLFFFPPTYYYYNSWSGWHNNYRYNRPYFGAARNGSRTYGTYGSAVKRSPKFQSTNFAKSGGFKSQTASVRGAGPNLRGGGPKSKGK